MNELRIVRNGLRLGAQDFRVFWRSWHIWVATHLLRVATSAATWILLGRLLESEELVHFLLVGQIAIVGPQFAGWTVQAFTWDRAFMGTYPMLVAAPSSMVPAMLGRTAVWLLNGIATAVATLAILAPLFGLPLSAPGAAGMVLILVVICTSAYGFAFCLGSLVNWIPRLRNVIQNVSIIVITGICGVVVPLTFWPAWVQGVAHALPVTHGLQSIRLVLAGGPPSEIALGIAIEVLVGVAWFGIGVLALDRTVNLARRTGAIELI